MRVWGLKLGGGKKKGGSPAGNGISKKVERKGRSYPGPGENGN